ncbi:MAG TPA: formaldehyde-activating enzyme [Acidimicrobiales bacterium]|nr:formaldehyde-activating enzyme [Acidimicrobiales bacterium]
MEVGEGFAGSGAEAAHVNTVLGERSGPVGAAFVTILGSPSAGHVPFLVVARPNLPVRPPTLFVNKAPLAGPRHERLTWGAAQAGVAAGVVRAVADGTLDPARTADVVLVAAVWVDPAAADEEAVFANNAAATHLALQRGAGSEPDLAELLLAGADPFNPFFRNSPPPEPHVAAPEGGKA